VVAWRAGFFDDGSRVSGEVLLGTDDRTLTASVYWTGCEDRPRLVAHESSDAVTLEVVRQRHAPDDAVCDDAQAQQMTVRLAAPLGHRRLGSVGAGVVLGVFVRSGGWRRGRKGSKTCCHPSAVLLTKQRHQGGRESHLQGEFGLVDELIG
jgi:hypothetical protein